MCISYRRTNTSYRRASQACILACISHRRASYRHASQACIPGVYPRRASVTGVHLLPACISYRRAFLTGVHLLPACILWACISYRRAYYRHASLTDVYLIGVHLLQAYISQARGLYLRLSYSAPHTYLSHTGRHCVGWCVMVPPNGSGRAIRIWWF